jgi:hypothetical protein
LFSWILERINVSTGLFWFHTIITGTLFSHLLLLPFSIKLFRNSAAFAPHQLRLIELLLELDQAYKARDKLAVHHVALKQRKVYEESGVSMFPRAVDAVRAGARHAMRSPSQAVASSSIGAENAARLTHNTLDPSPHQPHQTRSTSRCHLTNISPLKSSTWLTLCWTDTQTLHSAAHM